MAADEALTDIGELLFSILIGYLGALEFAFVARHLFHWTWRHPNTNEAVDAAADAVELPRMRDRLDKELAEAAAREAAAGNSVMQDGVLYSNGFRVESPEEKRKALAAELERQRQQLAEAEAKLVADRKTAEEERMAAKAAEEAAVEAENARKLIEAENERAREQREREEKERQLIEAETKRREQEERLDNERKLLEAEKQREAEQREREENERKLQEIEKQHREKEENERIQREAEQQREHAENDRKLKEAEERRLEEQRQRETAEEEAEQRVLAALDEEEQQAKRDAEIVERLLAAERDRKLSATESELEEEALILEETRRMAASKADLEKRQRSIEENARLFMEAEEEMVMLQQRKLQAALDQQEDEYAGCIPVVEEPCIKKILPPRFEEPTPEPEAEDDLELDVAVEEPVIVHRVKTQFGQTSGAEDPYKVKSKTLMFPGVSDEGSSVEPISSQQSSFSTHPSEECSRQITEEERQEPEGEDYVPDVQYTDDYLRSLDGIKSRPLVREDGSGRRRAFKKRRSSGSSNSSRESRASRDEELKMFTSLEEEELKHGEKADYNPIKYTTEPTLRVKSHHRRHKRSPAKDAKPAADASSCLEMLGEESTNPWGEGIPEHYKDTEFWKREKALSIDEENVDLEKKASGEDVPELAKNKPSTSSFEEATSQQNEQASTLLHQLSKEQLDKDNEVHKDKDSTADSKATDTSSSDIKSNLQTSQVTEEQPRRGSPSLRRSPRIDEMHQYEERWRLSEEASHPSQQPPNITIHQPDTAPWRDRYGLLMEGISDFYDFTASVNPSRSRSSSRNPSPQPKNVTNRMDVDREHTIEVYDDTQDGMMSGEVNCELILQMLQSSLRDTESPSNHLLLQNVADDVQNGNTNQVVPMVYETTESMSVPQTVSELEQSIVEKDLTNGTHVEVSEEDDPAPRDSVLPQSIIEINVVTDPQLEELEPNPTKEEMQLFVESLRAERNSRSRSRSRSRSPLPTSDNIARSLESRRLKRIKQNDELFEKMQEEQHSTSSVPTPQIQFALPTISIELTEDPLPSSQEDPEPKDTPESMATLFEQLRLERCQSHSRSRSRSRSPLPSAANLEQSLQKRRERLIAQNDALFEQLEQRGKTPEPEVRVIVEYIESSEIYEDDPIQDRNMRSLSPSRSRSQSQSPTGSNCPASDDEDLKEFHLLLNLEGSEQRTLYKDADELENILPSTAKRQREIDLEALLTLNNANEEVELRVMSPPKSEYERTTSEVARDLRDEMLVSGFNRSTYVGESLDLGSEFEELRRDCATFQRSHSPSPSMAIGLARQHAETQRELQAAILQSLVTDSGGEQEKRLGAKPKTNEYGKGLSEEVQDTQRMKEEPQDMGISSQLDDLRHRTAEFQRSRSQSRSPVRDVADSQALQQIEAEAAKREFQDQLLDQLAASSVNFQNFSRYLNADFLESERRASDSALIQLDPLGDLEPEEYHHFRRYSLAQEQPVEEYPSDEYVYLSQIEVNSLTDNRMWLKEDFYNRNLEDLEVSSISVGEPTKKSEYLSEGSWARAVLAAEAEAAEFDETSAIYDYDILGEFHANEDGSTNDSDDERQTVVEIDDDEYEFELDEGISDYNERTQPTDESHHDTSECEEAERNADRYVNRGANDWEEVENLDDLSSQDYHIDDGAVGGTYSDPDFYIEQIYNDAVKNRKQSGILLEYETMINEQLSAESGDQGESEKEKSSSDSERYALWAKTRQLDRSEDRNHDLSIGLLDSERRDTDMRYLGDAQVAARQSTRLRTRYGYSPKLQVDVVEDDIEVDMNYKPKREYNWRKNFKLDDIEPNVQENSTQSFQAVDDHNPMMTEDQEQYYAEINEGTEEMRRFSVGGESITLFSRSPVREVLPDVPEEVIPEQENGAQIELEPEIEPHVTEPQLEADVEPEVEAELAAAAKPKKKKSKKKSRKESKTEEELRDDNDSDNQQYCREDADAIVEPPKRKMRSRRSSKSSASRDEDENNGSMFSPRSSISHMGEALEGIAELEGSDEPTLKKKTKKRKKLTKESNELTQMPTELEDPEMDRALVAALSEIAPITISASTNLTPASTQQNLLSSISAGHSVCLTPASSFEEPLTLPITNNHITAVAPEALPAPSVVDTFDILKDANFYPLF